MTDGQAMNEVNATELQSVLTADLDRATRERSTNADNALPTLTKLDLAELLFDHVGPNKREAKEMIDAFFDEIRDALERGEQVKHSGFGNFQLRDKPQRPGRNPKTGDVVRIPARRVVTFHASQKLRNAANVP
jgi:integration host factor subunit alpha